MHERPFFSVITVVYNGAAHIEQTIKSVLDQGYPNVEYIIIDGGSTDGTQQIIQAYEQQLTYWVSEPDRGIYHAMNKGAQKATGTYISFLNADDYLLPESFSKMAQAHYETRADILYGNQVTVWEDGGEVLTKTYIPSVDVIERKMGLFHPATFVKRSVFESVGGFDESFDIAGDYDFFIRLHKNKYTFQYVPFTIAAFRKGGVSSSLKTYLEGIRIQWKYNLPHKRSTVMSLFTRSIKYYVNRIVFKPLGIDEKRKRAMKKQWRNTATQEVIMQ